MVERRPCQLRVCWPGGTCTRDTQAVLFSSQLLRFVCGRRKSLVTQRRCSGEFHKTFVSSCHPNKRSILYFSIARCAMNAAQKRPCVEEACCDRGISTLWLKRFLTLKSSEFQSCLAICFIVYLSHGFVHWVELLLPSKLFWSGGVQRSSSEELLKKRGAPPP